MVALEVQVPEGHVSRLRLRQHAMTYIPLSLTVCMYSACPCTCMACSGSKDMTHATWQWRASKPGKTKNESVLTGTL